MKVSLNRQKCELVADVEFSDEAITELEWLAEYCVLYADPGAEGRQAPLFMAPDMAHSTNERRQRALHTLVIGVKLIWRGSGGVGSGVWYDMKDAERNGPLVRLLESMFEQAGVKPTPSARTLRRAIQATSTTS